MMMMMMMMILTVFLLYTTCVHMQTQVKTGELCCSGMNGLLISDFGSSTRGERHNSYYADHAMLTIPNVRHIL